MERISSTDVQFDYVNPEMVVLAREARGLSQSALAEHLALSQGALSKMESAQLPFTTDILAAVAGILEVPVSLFQVPARPFALPLPFYRKKAKLGAKAVRQLRAKVALTRLRIETLLRSTEAPEPRLVLGDVDGRRHTPERVASELRVHWRLAPGPIPNLTDVVESAGVMVVQVDFGTPLLDGMSIWEPSDVLPPMVFVNTAAPADRYRWTLAHELGHVVLHHHLSTAPQGDVEQEADAFAGELLMPAADIRGYLYGLTLPRLAQLKQVWRVSMRALVMRAKSMNRITDGAARRLFIELNAFGSKHEPVEITREKPTLLHSMVERHMSTLGYTAAQLAEMLHQRVEEFRADFQLGRSALRLA